MSAVRSYRPDIDGLRAIAVLSILFNHVGLRGFGGGYIGVDIFFVISGNLITGILLRDIEAGRYAIGDFYRRRILRIFPALFVMLAAVTVLGVATMLPGELVRYARSLGATALFSSNIEFYSEAGYFDSASHAKPLLHTWSLAIEEQFYLLWPLALAAIGAGRLRSIRAAMIGISLVSFVAAEWLIRLDMSAAFYLLPSRAWELGLGGLLTVPPAWPRARAAREVLAGGAILAIALCCWRYSNLTPFPGATAAIPCLGAALLILFAPGTLVGRVLSLRPIVFVGLISYSLYLWHWPIVIFAQTWLLLPTNPIIVAAEILLSFALATASWRFVETPFRDHGHRWPARKVLVAGLLGTIVTLLAASALIAARGLPERFTSVQQALARYNDGDFEASYRRGSCFVVEPLGTLDPACVAPRPGSAPRLLLVGDSMAADLWPGLAHHRDRYDIMQATTIGCPPALYDPGSSVKCQRFFRSTLLGWRQSGVPSAILLSGLWHDSDLPALDATLVEMRRRGVPIMLIGPMPNYTAALPRILVAADRRGDPDLVIRSQDAFVFALDAAMRALAKRNDAAYISPIEALCRGRTCRTLAAPGVPLQFDKSHMTPAGSAVVVDLLMPRIAAALPRH